MVPRIVICILILVTVGAKSAGQTPQFVLSHRSLIKVEGITSAEKKLRVYKKYFHRDSLKFNRKLKKYYRHFSDSLRMALNSSIEESTRNRMLVMNDSSITAEKLVDSISSTLLIRS